MCVDPEEWDANSNGMLEGSELKAFCDTRCDPAWSVTQGLAPPWNYYTCGTETPTSTKPDANQDFWSCEAIDPDQSGGLPAPKIEPEDFHACNPYENANGDNEYPSYEESMGLDVDPIFETDFSSSSSGSELEIWISGTELVPSSYNLNAKYYLDGCEHLGNDEWRCDFVLTGLALTMSTMTFGDFLLHSVELTLNERVGADVFFVPDGPGGGAYVGSFELSEAEGNAVGTNLSWTQINRPNETSIDNMLHLGNTDGSLGGLDEIYGIVHTSSSGTTLRLIGYGTDSITGGDWASVDFDLVDDAVPITN